jgi:hypothetical protein
MNATALRLALASESTDMKLAAKIVDAVRPFRREELFALLVAAGVEGLRAYDSKAYMLRRLHNALTARVRAIERSEV